MQVNCLITSQDRLNIHSNDYRFSFKQFYQCEGCHSKVCSLLEWLFIISIWVSSDRSQLRCMGFAGSHNAAAKVFKNTKFWFIWRYLEYKGIKE